ncbi:MAG: hypothetical protein WCF44_19515 [Candidatus Methylophosphatis roskildensis]
MLGATLLCSGLAYAQADAEPTDMDPRLLAKMAKVRAKQDVQENKSDADGEGGGNSSGLPSCAVNIGNSVNAPRGNAPKEIAVFVKGDVIVSGNKCK